MGTLKDFLWPLVVLFVVIWLCLGCFVGVYNHFVHVQGEKYCKDWGYAEALYIDGAGYCASFYDGQVSRLAIGAKGIKNAHIPPTELMGE